MTNRTAIKDEADRIALALIRMAVTEDAIDLLESIEWLVKDLRHEVQGFILDDHDFNPPNPAIMREMEATFRQITEG